jgi:hypothetical protein
MAVKCTVNGCDSEGTGTFADNSVEGGQELWVCDEHLSSLENGAGAEVDGASGAISLQPPS